MKGAFPDIPFTYVCADEHYYHERSFDGIDQYIVGSGGTDLDPIPPPERKSSDTLVQYRREHGYLVLDSSGFQFVSVEGMLRATARKRKRKQTKKKKKRKKRTYRRR